MNGGMEECQLTSTKNTRLPNPIPIDRQRDIPQSIKHAYQREPNLERVKVVLAQIRRSLHKPDDEEVSYGQQPRGANGVVRPDV